MIRALGANMQLLFQRASVFKQAPSPAAAFKIPFISYGVRRDPRKVNDPSINNDPLPAKSGCGDPVVGGPIRTVLDLRNMGHFLSLLLGVPTANKAVTKQPTNCTGVSVEWAHASCTAGDGTLAFTAAGTTLTWTAQGDTAGTPVDVSAGGRFTLQSGTASHSLSVFVTPASLPVVDKSDADIAVSATLKAHVFPINTTERPDALLELGHLDVGTYYRTLGAKVTKISWDMMGEQNISIDIIAGGDETPENAVFDAAPTSYTIERACGAGGTVSNGVDGNLGIITAGSIEIDMGMKGVEAADGQPGYGFIEQGDVKIGGKMTTVFDGAGAYAAARAGDSTRLRFVSKKLVGSDLFQLVVDCPQAELTNESAKREGKTGVYAEMDWMAHQGANLPLVMLVNDVTSY